MNDIYVVRNTEAAGSPVVCVTKDGSLAWTLARNIVPRRPWELPDQYDQRIEHAVELTTEITCTAPEVE